MYPRHMAESLLERCAQSVSDPVQRLQLLRHAAGPTPQVTAAVGWILRRHNIWPRFLSLTGLAILILIASSVATLVEGRSHALGSLPPAPIQIHESADVAAVPAAPSVWLVEAARDSDLYSNGLRIENQYVTESQARSYRVLPRGAGGRKAEMRQDPAGIVFHTTESHMAPFEEDQNYVLRRAGEGLLEYVSRRRSYHFVVDRFGRVFRIVRESDRANHAGHSIWADEKWIYINLNDSFFGVAFEAQSRRKDDPEPLNHAQIHAGRVLTDMLRARYAIPAENCVAHGQVSINPDVRQAAYHTDWSAQLPFDEFGLPNNYSEPLPSVALFGFTTDPSFVAAASPVLQNALLRAEGDIQEQAAARHVSAERYRKTLQQTYRDTVRALASSPANQEN